MKKKGCLGILLAVIAVIAAFLFWPIAADDSVILSDSFDNNHNNWVLGNYGSIENGQLILSEDDISLIPTEIQLKNGRISVSLIYISAKIKKMNMELFLEIRTRSSLNISSSTQTTASQPG